MKTLVNAGPNRHTQGSNTFALLNDGTVRAWGSSGLLGNGTDSGSNVPLQVSGLTGVSSLAIGGSVAYATLTDGTVRSWGRGYTGQLGSSSTWDSNVPVDVTGLSGVVSVTAGSSSAYALKTDGTVWSWGNNQYGQLGNGTISNSSNVPTKMTGLTGVTKVMM
ncbi:UNVERIFIED_ORG: alpha-tubulin suppressor-like RCC1 family protein [Arthrobacter sp. UYCu721]